MINHHLRKNRYIQLEDENGVVYIAQLDSSKIEKLPQVNFDIFNIPVECVKIKNNVLIDDNESLIFDDTMILLSNGHLPDSTFISMTGIEDDVDVVKLYVPLSKIRYADEKYKEVFQKLRERSPIDFQIEQYSIRGSYLTPFP
jgi:hypothetical protein